mmetsp:Transcript_4700/g.13044  ORF Transcript_4700/g.13044 Transcript_4700/m.13044 type:complete len:227 (+) Transcript_4700:291-971(+)
MSALTLSGSFCSTARQSSAASSGLLSFRYAMALLFSAVIMLPSMESASLYSSTALTKSPTLKALLPPSLAASAGLISTTVALLPGTCCCFSPGNVLSKPPDLLEAAAASFRRLASFTQSAELDTSDMLRSRRLNSSSLSNILLMKASPLTCSGFPQHVAMSDARGLKGTFLMAPSSSTYMLTPTKPRSLALFSRAMFSTIPRLVAMLSMASSSLVPAGMFLRSSCF